MAEVPSLSPRNLSEALEFCKRIADTNFVPAAFKGKPDEILAALQFGAEIGLSPMQSLQGIAVINGRPSVWGDAMLALVRQSGLLEWIKETDDGTTATCVVKRKGDPEPHTCTFSDKDAQAAGLLQKSGPWQQYRPRMRKFRARGFSLRDVFPDVLKGAITREEAEDYVTVDAQDVGQLSPEETPRAKELKVVADGRSQPEVSGFTRDPEPYLNVVVHPDTPVDGDMNATIINAETIKMMEGDGFQTLEQIDNPDDPGRLVTKEEAEQARATYEQSKSKTLLKKTAEKQGQFTLTAFTAMTRGQLDVFMRIAEGLPR